MTTTSSLAPPTVANLKYQTVFTTLWPPTNNSNNQSNATHTYTQQAIHIRSAFVVRVSMKVGFFTELFKTNKFNAQNCQLKKKKKK